MTTPELILTVNHSHSRKQTFLACCVAAIAAASGSSAADAQGLPQTQPKFITIIREEVKVGRAFDHAKDEAGWPAAFEKAKSPNFYLAMTSLTGSPEAWYVVPWESYAKEAESMKREDSDPVLSSELARLGRADAEYVNAVRVIRGAGRPDLSLGTFPDISKMRFLEITCF